MNFTPITAMSYLEPLLWATALCFPLRFKSRASFPAFQVFLAIRTFGAFLLLGISHAPQIIPGAFLKTSAFSAAYWVVYIAGCVAMYFALRDIFLSIMAPLPGLSRVGSILFRWAAVVSLGISVLSVSIDFAALPAGAHLPAVAASISSGMSILVLCLLSLLVVCAHSLGQSYRSWGFGICLGSGVMAAAELVASAFSVAGLRVWTYNAGGIATLVALAIWIAYMFIPEARREQKDVAAVSSTLSQWNDLAQELGPNTQPQPAMQQSGFLQNVESVVDRVLAKNSVGGG